MKSRVLIVLIALAFISLVLLRLAGPSANERGAKGDANSDPSANDTGDSSENQIAVPAYYDDESGELNVERRRVEGRKIPEREARWIGVFSGEPAPKTTPEQNEAFVTANDRSVESLLAVFESSEDKEWLTEAALNFPDDPRVQMAMINFGTEGDERSDWIGRLRTSDPDNALGDYFSAADHMQNGRESLAVADFMAAAQKTGVTDYSADTIRSAEQLYLSAGHSAVDAKVFASTQTRMPHLSKLKNLAFGMADLQAGFAERGETQLAADLAKMGIKMGRQFNQEASGQFILNQLIGAAFEKKFLSQLDPSQSYDFLPEGVTASLESLEAQKQQVKDAVRVDFTAQSPENISGYFDRMKTEGEFAALQWLNDQQINAPLAGQ